MVSSVDGLVSGLSTSGLIDQLMTLESAGQTKLKNKVTVQKNVNSAFQSLNTKVANLKSAAAALVDPATWKATTATSSDTTAVTATGSTSAVPGDYTVSVSQLAKAHQRSAVVAAKGSITDGPVKITIGGTDYAVTPATQDARGVASAINASGSGVRASVIETEDGTVLQLTAAKTGAASQFSVSGIPGLELESSIDRAGQDAKLTIPGGYTVTSSTNTFTGAIPGVTLTATKEATDVTVSVRADAAGIANKVESMIGLANGLLGEVKTKSAQPDKQGSAAGPLAGNFLVRTLATDLLGSVARGVDGHGSLATVGIETNRDGTIKFDKSKFLAAYEADPASAQAMILGGLAPAMQNVAASGGTSLTAVIQNGESTIKSLNKQIESWDIRLTTRRASLQKEYSNLEVALGKLQSQSEWLAGQITAINANNG